MKNIFRPKLIILSIFGFVTFGICTSVSAVSLSDFNPGNIIDDIVMSNSQSMNVDQIQAFLNSKVPVCDNWGTNGSTSTSRRDYFNSRGWPLPLTCLKDFQENGKSSAQIIYDAAQEYTINPQVLIVLLQKEQGLVTDDWPDPTQYRAATGYGCPDTAACDSYYYGFTNQVRNAAKMYRRILDASPNWYTPYVLGVNYIQYSPDPNCGGSWVNIQNRATQGLYNYTPYQPNQASLNAGYGSGDYCSSHGNRNFYLYFNDWFGTVRGYQQLDNPRWMEVINDINKITISSGEETSQQITGGTQLMFTTKVFARGQWYLRTEYDSNNSIEIGIPLSNLREIPYTPISTPTYMEFNKDSNKFNPLNSKMDGAQFFKKGFTIKINDEITVNGVKYYRSVFDNNNNINRAIKASDLSPISYVSFENPRYMVINKETQKINPSSNIKDENVIPKDTQFKFTSKTTINGVRYFRTEEDTNNNIQLAIPSSDINELSFNSFGNYSKWFQLKESLQKIDFFSQISIGGIINAGKKIRVVQKVQIGDTLYYRTEYDFNNNINYMLPSNSFEEIPYIPMDNPRIMKLTISTKKINPKTGEEDSEIINSGQEIMFSTKIEINGKIFLRSKYDTDINSDFCVSLSNLRNM